MRRNRVRPPFVERRMVDLLRRGAALLTLISALTVSACGGIFSGTTDDTRDAIRAAAANLPQHYTYVLTSNCGERPLIGRYEIVVADRDRVVSGKPADADTDPVVSGYPTIRSLLDEALNADSNAVIEFEADAAGLPARLSIDPIPEAIDDEGCYTFTGITRVPG